MNRPLANFKFKIVVPSFNSQKWIERCLASIEKQTQKNYDVCVVDDASTDPSQQKIIQFYCEKHGWNYMFNSTNMGALYNIVNAINALKPNDEDVIVTLDGDDWFYNNKVLEKLFDIYSRADVYLTYGQFITFPRWNIGSCRPISDEDIERQNYRNMPWQFGHLRTFKYYLWRHVADKDLRDDEGNYYKIAWDLAFMYPMLEMAGYHIKYVNDLTYVYNKGNPINDHKVRAAMQLSVANTLRKKPKYTVLIPGKMNTNTATALGYAKNFAIKAGLKIGRVLWQKS
jgi:glycosyltransferase involved in cell wall biosynthesis